MPRTPRGSRTTGAPPVAARPHRILRGLASLLLLTALVAGLPVLLAVLGGNPLPDHVPGGAEVGHALTSPDDGSLFLAALTIVGWIGWATFAFSVLVELVAVVRRRPAVRLPGLRAQQRLAASLLAGVALLIGTATAATAIGPAPLAAMQSVAAPAAGAAVSPVSSMPASPSVSGVDGLNGASGGRPGPVSAVPAAGAPTAASWSRAVDLSALPVAPPPVRPPAQAAAGGGGSAPALPVRVPGASTLPGQRVAAAGPQVYIVERGDRLATIASRFLGDPDRYPELAQASVIEDPDVIRPGQLIVLPPGTHDGGSRAHAAGHAHPRPNPNGPGLYVVTTGDTLYDIADRFLGDPNRYPELAAVSRVPEPDEISPGLRLILPAGARDRGSRPHATGVLLNPPQAAPTSPAPKTPAPKTPAPKAPAPKTPAKPANPGGAAPATPRATPSRPAPTTPAPTTPAPTTPAPTTPAPTTAAPTTAAPSPSSPATGAPGGAAPTPAAPSSTATGAPGGAAPSAPATSAPAGAPGGSTAGGSAPERPAAVRSARPPATHPAPPAPADQPRAAAFTRALLDEPLWAGGLLTGAGLLSALLLARRRRDEGKGKDEWRGKHRRAGRLDRHATLRRNPLVPQPRAGDLSTDDEPWLLPEFGAEADAPTSDGRHDHRHRAGTNVGFTDRTGDDGVPLVPGAPTDAAVTRLDEALRSLGAALADRPAQAMPDVIGAWLSGGMVSLVLTEPCPDPPPPWSGADFLWTLPEDAPLDVVDDQLPPLPTLVTVGSRDGGHLLLDLERLGVLTITGDPWRANDLLRFVAAELACNAWSDDVEITLAGFDPEQTAQLIALGGDRADSVPTVAEGIQHIRARLHRAFAAMESAGHADEDLLRPQVLLAADPDLDETMALSELDAELAGAGRCAVAVVATIRGNLGRWPVAVFEDGRITADFVGVTDTDDDVAAARLSRTALLSLAELLTVSR